MFLMQLDELHESDRINHTIIASYEHKKHSSVMLTAKQVIWIHSLLDSLNFLKIFIWSNSSN